VPDGVSLICKVPDFAGAVDFAGAGFLAEAAGLAGAVALVGAGVFSEDGVLGVVCSGVAGAAWPAEAGSGVVRTSGTSGAFPLSMPALLWLAPASSVVPASLLGTLESGASWWDPVSMWTSDAGGLC
jgi:hypothetical protein